MVDHKRIMSLLIQGVSYSDIAARCRCSRATISKINRVVKDHQFTVNQVETLGPEELAGLFPDQRSGVSAGFVEPDFTAITDRRIRRGGKSTLKVEWERYTAADAPPGLRFYSYQQFCARFNDYAQVHNLTEKLSHEPGQCLFVDWAGSTMALVDPLTDQTTKVSVFVACLPYSGMIFAKGFLDEKLSSWLRAHQDAFAYLGGVPEIIVPDNTSTASVRIHVDEAARKVQETYFAFADYHDCAVVPTRVNRPKDKAAVETAVGIVDRWVIEYLEIEQFHSLTELNEAIATRIDHINAQPFRGGETTRFAELAAFEAPHLQSLPERAWTQSVWRKAKVGPDYHIQVDHRRYSVPYTYVGTTVDVQLTDTEVLISADHQRIAAHHRNTGRKGSYTTDATHAPANHQLTASVWSRDRFINWATRIGPATVQVITAILDAARIEAQAYATCNNILARSKQQRQRLEDACQQILDRRLAPSYTSVRTMMQALASNRTNPTTPRPAETGDIPELPSTVASRSGHVRGPDHFRATGSTGQEAR